ncbi:MAG: hypothetical protein A2Y62_10290 [Candidatus Fischerbacteria bacterium RBG_13_37_8]|uniref:RiboL-PSP-HEPN domain-containing protein n=1 Tax=Candidatus Fischerbacteria bacterium RBG_13_37_8 TaxID=1817863 RepID=A0A1F5VNE9_9BACT|nr:MAG: hypothetical protein A2Y62_10290 [Candidatus Fischerbacteria bacterium RBG_13_37_8]
MKNKSQKQAKKQHVSKAIKKNEEMEITFSRHEDYYRIACDAMRQIDVLQKEASIIPGRTDDEAARIGFLNNTIEKVQIVVIVFCAMSLEAFIYNYACHQIESKTFFDAHLDKLSAEAKWRIFPQLITGKSLRTEGKDAAYLFIRDLFKLRNELVHYKSHQTKISNLHEHFITNADAQNATKAVKLAIMQLHELDQSVSKDWLRNAEDEIPWYAR